MPEHSQPNAPPHDPSTSSRFFEAWAKFVLRHRWWMLALTFSVTGWFGWQAYSKTVVDNSVEAFAADDSQAQSLLEEFRDEFGQDGLYLVMAEGDVFTPGYLSKLRKLHDELASLNMDIPSLGERKSDRDRRKGLKRRGAPIQTDSGDTPAKEAAPPRTASATEDDFEGASGDAGGDGFDEFEEDGAAANGGWGSEKGGTIIEEATSLINVRRTRGRGDAIEVGKLLDPMPSPEELPGLKAEVLKSPKYVGQVVGRNGKHSVIVLRTQFMNEADAARVFFAIEAICRKHATPDFKLGVAGPPALSAVLNKLMLSDLKTTGLIAIVAMLAALFFLFRHPMGMIGPLGVVVQAAVWTFGAMAWGGQNVTMLSNILPAFLVCVGIGDSVHLQSVYRDGRREGLSNDDAIVAAVSTTALPVLFTTLTTMVGLLSFRFASVTAISDMGTAGAWGVSVALLHSLVFLPVVLSFNKTSLLGARGAGGTDGLDRWLSIARLFSFDAPSSDGRSNHRRRRRALALMAFLFLCFGGLTSLLKVFHHPLTWIPPDRPVRGTFEVMDAELGGTANVQLMFETKDGKTVKDLDLLRGMDKLDAHIRSYVNPKDGKLLVGNVISLVDVVKETHQALHGDDPAYYRLPDTDRGVSDMLFMFENAGPEQLRRLATNDLRKTHMTVRVRWVDATSYGDFTEHIAKGIKLYIGDRAVVKPTGAIYSLFSVIASLIKDLIRSFGVAFVAITIMMVLMLKNVRLGLIAMVPNLLPIIVIMGGMGLIGIPIDMSTLLIASIAIGIAVDDTIHFLHHFQVHYLAHGSVEDAISYTFSHSGRAMVSTSVILCGGFCVYMAAAMYNIGRFGALVAATVVLALVIDLLFAPALLRTFYRDRNLTPSRRES